MVAKGKKFRMCAWYRYEPRSSHRVHKYCAHCNLDPKKANACSSSASQQVDIGLLLLGIICRVNFPSYWQFRMMRKWWDIIEKQVINHWSIDWRAVRFQGWLWLIHRGSLSSWTLSTTRVSFGISRFSVYIYLHFSTTQLMKSSLDEKARKLQHRYVYVYRRAAPVK